MAARDFNLPPREPEKPRLVPSPPRKSRWYKVVAWILGIITLVIVIAVTGIHFLLHSQRFHDYVLKTAEQKATEALNTPVKVQNFTLSLHPIAINLYGLTVDGTGPGANQPLLQVDHIGVSLQILSVIRRQWNLQNVAVDHPVVSLLVNSAGENNLPTLKPSNSKSKTDVFDLAIRHVLLDRGEIYYNDHKSSLYADVHELRLESQYGAADGGQYSGTVSYRDGHLTYGAYKPIPHDLQASFDARRDGMSLSKVVLKSGTSQVLLDASLKNYSSPIVHAKYVVLLNSGELRRTIGDPSLPIGVILVDGTADYASVPGKSALETSTIQGTLKSAVLRVRTPSLGLDIRNLGASYSLQNGNAEIGDLRASLLGGELTGSAIVRDISGKQQGHVAAAMHGIQLAALKPMANSASLKQIAISGSLNADAEANWSGSTRNIIARTNATANAKLAPTGSNGAAVPVNAVIHARYAGPRQEVTLNQSYIRTAETSINLNGTVSKRSALQIQAQANDLHELETIADVFRTPKPGEPGPQLLNLHGTASFNGTVTGSTAAPNIAGQLNAKNLQVRGTGFRTVRASLQASPSFVSVQNGLVVPAKQGRLTFNAQSGLHNWSHTPSSDFAITLNASRLSLADLARAANANTPISGTLDANLTAHGTQLNPIGQGEITLHNAVVSGEPIQAANVRFNGTGDAVHANLLVKISAGSATGQVTYYPKQEGYDALLQATNIHLEQIRSLSERNMDLSGVLNLKASGRGTLKDPQGQASLTIPQLKVKGQEIRDINFQGNVANHEAAFTLGSQVLNTPLRAQGKVALNGDYYADASLDTPVIPLQPLLATYAPAQAANVGGETEIHATIRGPLKKKELMEAHLSIPVLQVQYQKVHLGAVNPIRADYVNGVVALQPGEIRGTDTDIHFQGRLPVNSNAPSTLNVTGNIDLGIVEMFDPAMTSSGQLVLDINAAGHRVDENVEGQIRIVNASFATPDAPLGLTNGNGVLTLRRDRVDITRFTGAVGGGTVSASGSVAYRPAIQFHVGLQGSDLRLLYPATVRTDLGMDLAMTGNMQDALLQGTVNINRVSFTPDFDLTSFASQFGGVATPPPTGGFQDILKLNIAVRSTSELNIISPTVSVQGSANLRVIGTAADPVIVGRTNLTGGDVIVLGNRYLLQGGTIAFVNTLQTEPILNLQVNTTIQQYNIAMRFQGPLDRLHTSYNSDPSLPPADIINLIACGQPQEASNAAPPTSTQLGAESLVASQVTGQITSRVQKIAGISQLSVDPQLGNNGNQPPGARITVQQRVTSKLFVTFSTDVTATQNSAIQMQYQINRKWSVSGVRDQNGGFGLDGRYHKDF